MKSGGEKMRNVRPGSNVEFATFESIKFDCLY